MAGAQEEFSASNNVDTREGTLDTDHAARQAAATADYAEALAVYEARSDVEPLLDRRAREAGTAFTDADFVRDPNYVGFNQTTAEGVVTDPDGVPNSGDETTAAPVVPHTSM
jgi:hypothetical protein